MLVCHVSGIIKFFFGGYGCKSFKMYCMFIVKKNKNKFLHFKNENIFLSADVCL